MGTALTSSQKAAKALATRNAAKLNQMLLVALAIHSTFLVLRVGLFRKSFTKGSLVRYIIFSSPSWLIQFWFERMGRPVYTHSSDGTPELKRSGEDLEAKGLTEYMWDVLYWTYGCLVLVALLGDWAWWAWVGTTKIHVRGGSANKRF